MRGSFTVSKTCHPTKSWLSKACSVAPFPKESKSACARCPLRQNGLHPSSRTPGQRAPINSRWKKLTRKLRQHGVSAASARTMIRVVIDTNVLVSALLTRGGLPEAVINLAISGEVQCFASESVLAEYEEVLKTPPAFNRFWQSPQTQWPGSLQLSPWSHRQ
jgi:hypothetical protein